MQIRSDGASRPDITIRLMESMLSLARNVKSDEQMEAVQNLAELIAIDSKDALTSQHDHKCVDQLYSQIKEIC